MSKPRLISFNVCPFVQRSVILMQEKGVEYDIEFIDVYNPPEWFLALSPTQWQLLVLLAKHSPNIIDRITIENEIWPDLTPSKDMLKTLAFRLRSLVDNENELNLNLSIL